MKKVELRKVELWSDSEIDKLSELVYEECKGKDCDQCPNRLEINNETCKADIIQELWRKWQNESDRTRSKLLRLRNDLYKNDQITLKGLGKMNRLIYGVEDVH